MNNIERFQNALNKVSKVASLLNDDKQAELKVKSEEFLNEVQESQYIKVPLVGVFSAGKSSLLNVFTQKPGMLPVDTMPETAVAYELYYSTIECVELYRRGNKIDSKPLSDIKMLNTEPGDIAKVYCMSEPIKNLQERGIILVDMPGIGSGIERHDAAIFNYVGSGTAFVLIVDAEQGSLRGSTLMFMNELSRYNMYPAVLVSKIDKKPEDDVKDIVEYIQYQMVKQGNKNPFISTVCSVNNNLSGLTNYLSSLNPETLVAEKLGKKLNSLVNDIIEQLKIRVVLRNKDIGNIDEKLKQIEADIANVKAELPVKDSTADSPEKSTQDILDNVRVALEAKVADIAQMIIDKEDKEAIKEVIVSTVRVEIIASLKDESEQYATALGTAVQEAVQELATIELDAGILDDFSDIINVVSEYLGGVLGALGGIWTKIAGILLPFLPDVINWFFGRSDADILAEVCDKVASKCIEPVVSQLQPTIYKMTVENQKRIQERIQADLISKMETIKDGLREKLADANKTKEEISSEVEELNAAISHLKEILVEY